MNLSWMKAEGCVRYGKFTPDFDLNLRIASAELILHPLAIPRVSVTSKMIIFSDLIAAS